MLAVGSSEDIKVGLAKPPGWRPTPWIAAAGHRLHLRLCAVHGWATSLDGIGSPSLYHVTAAAIGRLLVFARSAIAGAMERDCGAGQAAATLGNISANSATHSGNAQAAIVVGSKPQNGA
jgi:hypothetical protein